MQADALSVDFTADDATATNQVEQKKKSLSGDARLRTTRRKKKRSSKKSKYQLKKRRKDWDKAHEMYDSILKASKNKEKVSNAVAYR